MQVEMAAQTKKKMRHKHGTPTSGNEEEEAEEA